MYFIMLFALKYFHMFRLIVRFHLSTILNFSSFSVEYQSTLCLCSKSFIDIVKFFTCPQFLRWGLRSPQVLECFCNFKAGFCLQREGPAIFTEHVDNHENVLVTSILINKRLHFHKVSRPNCIDIAREHSSFHKFPSYRFV